MESTELARLRQVAGKQTTRLTHYGRKTGKPHEVTIWFVLDGDRLYPRIASNRLRQASDISRLSAGPALDSLREVIDFRRLPPRGGAATCLRASPADRIMVLSSVSYAQTCSVYQLKIGSKRDVVLSDLQKRGCDVKLNAPKNGLERAVVLLKDNEEYAYHELYFTDGKLFSLWSCSSWFTSAEKAFAALYKNWPCTRRLTDQNVIRRVFLVNAKWMVASCYKSQCLKKLSTK